MPGILVGIDGSDHATRALEWAMKMAAALQLPLTVLAVHQVAFSPWTGNPIILPDDRTAEAEARQGAEKAVAEAAGRLGHATPASVTVRAVSASTPARELIEASRDADMLVVGARGGGGFASLMMGSTSSQVVHHAHCPVVVMPHDS
jgi:nucleotide-binding universal stress UspA family protein